MCICVKEANTSFIFLRFNPASTKVSQTNIDAQQRIMDNLHQTQIASPTQASFETVYQLLRRMAKVGVALFLLLHFYHIVLIGLGPEVFNHFSLNYRQPLPRIVHLALFACILFYAIDSTRLLILDWRPRLWSYQRASILIAAVIFAVIFIPSALLILLDTFLPY